MTHRSAAVASLILAAVLSPLAAAQQPANPAPPAASASPFGGKSRDAKTFDVTFGGGTLEQYIEALRAASKDEPVNVMLSDDVRDARIPKVNLRGVSVFTAISSLEKVSRSTGGALSVSDFRNEGNDVIYSIRSSHVGVQAYPQGVGDSRLVVSLSSLVPADLDAAKRDERLSVVLSAIEAALRLGRPENAEAPAVALHKESGLLMVLGSSEDRQTVQSVLAELQQSLQGSGSFQSKTVELTHASSADAIRAVRDVIPEADGGLGASLTLKAETPTTLSVKGRQSDILRAQGIISFIDRVRPAPAELVEMRQKLASREAAFGDEIQSLQARGKYLQSVADELRVQLAGSEPQLAAAKAREETLLREIADLRTRLREAETRLVELAREKNAGKP